MGADNVEHILQFHTDDFAQVVPFDPGSDQLVSLDFTINNSSLTGEIINDTTTFSAYVDQMITMAGARYGIGGYGEHRTVYSRSRVFDAAAGDDEPRRLHLGTDIWGKPGTAVMSPLDGIVHSFAFNDRAGDYGSTIILSHQLDGISFHTLYGHLSKSSIINLQGGERIEKGEIIGETGVPRENGQWPPHLHFQVIKDLQGWSGDYPGVCKYSEREIYMKNCPDPDIVLRMNRYLREGC
jgi:murein DD-endopeptidase MepM/ murein hydrolase activator NlpD